MARAASTVVLFTFVLIANAFAADTVPLIHLADLFAPPDKYFSSVSPDGKWVTWIAPLKGVMNLWIASVEYPEGARPVTHDAARGLSLLTGTTWSHDGRHVLYLQDKNGNGNQHLYSVDILTDDVRDLTPFENVRVDIIGTSPKRPSQVLISLNRRDPHFGDLYLLDLRTAALTIVAENPGFTTFLVDDDLTPRAGTRVEAAGGSTIFRRVNGTWGAWINVPPEDMRTTMLLGFDRNARSIYALDSRNRDTAALVSIDIETGRTTVLAEDGRADIRDVLFDQRTHLPIGYAVMLARLEHKALSKQYAEDIEFLNSQKLGDWTVNSRSIDDRYWKVSSLSGKRFLAVLYDRHKRKVQQLYDTRPRLAAATLVPMHTETIKTRDDLHLTAYLSLPKDSDPRETGLPRSPVPLVLAVHGGPHNRDVFGFNAIHQWLANRGYAALSVNMRGSTGFGKTFINASKGEWGRQLDDDLLDAVKWAIASKIADPTRIAIMGESYGGYAVLTGLTRDPDLYACGIDFFGISDYARLSTLVQLSKLSGAINPMYINEFGDPATPFGQQLMREQSPLVHADHIKKPLLVIQGANDRSVDREQSDLMVSAVKAKSVPVTYLLYPDEGHGLRGANDLSAHIVADQFLANCLGGRSEPIDGNSLVGSSMQVVEGTEHIPGLGIALENRQHSPIP